MYLSTDEFLAAPRRFVTRRSRPALHLTDNGTNFVGAKKKLEDFYHLLYSQPTQESYLFDNGHTLPLVLPTLVASGKQVSNR